MFAAVAAVPFLLRYLGQERFGILSLIWIVVGYFSFLDMGLGRAVTVAVASLESRAIGQKDEAAITGTAALALFVLGLAAALLLAVVSLFVDTPQTLVAGSVAGELRGAFLWMLASLPFLLVSSALRGHLEGIGAFRILNLLRIPTGFMLFCGPCLTALYAPSLVWACASIFVVRLTHAVLLLQMVGGQMGFGRVSVLRKLTGAASMEWMRRLISFGGWSTASNLAGPLILYVDRFVISAVLSASAVAIYAVPFDVLSRLPVLVASLCSVLLPELARLSGFNRSDSASNRKGRVLPQAVFRLVERSTLISACVVAAVVVTGCLGAPAILKLWVGADFANQAAPVAQLLMLAFGINAMAQIPFTALQATGRVRAVAFLHIAELLPYTFFLVVLISQYGLAGAAWACVARSLFDYLALVWMWSISRQSCDVTPQLVP